MEVVDLVNISEHDLTLLPHIVRDLTLVYVSLVPLKTDNTNYHRDTWQIDNLYASPSEMTFSSTKGEKLHNNIRHNIIWTNQKTESTAFFVFNRQA